LLLHDGVANERADLQARGEVDPMLAPTHLELRTKIYQEEEQEQMDDANDGVDIEAPPIQDTERGNKYDTTDDKNDGEMCEEYNHREEEQPPQYHHDDEDGDVICAICMATVENGDRIGNLQCRHLFHVDCLKQWLRKKNECPMCSAKDIATRRAASS
jgi:hypothetical protein